MNMKKEWRLDGVKPDDELMMIGLYGPPQKVTVKKVGRTLVHVEWFGHCTKSFHKETGLINDDYGHHEVCTQEHYEERELWEKVFSRLRELDVSSKKLRRLLEVLEVMEEDE